MTVETRYCRGDQHTVNGLSAYILGTAQSNTARSAFLSKRGMVPIYWGIRVWKRNSAGTETEITSGTPVADVSRMGNGEGIQSDTWDCPETALASTDAIVVRVYMKWFGGPWYEKAKFITEQLGALKLDSATWTICYYTKYVYDGARDRSTGWFYWGTATYNSRISNFTWTPAPPPKYSCSGPPDYVCYEDPDGIYATLEECEAACVAPTPPPPAEELDMKEGLQVRPPPLR